MVMEKIYERRLTNNGFIKKRLLNIFKNCNMIIICKKKNY